MRQTKIKRSEIKKRYATGLLVIVAFMLLATISLHFAPPSRGEVHNTTVKR